MAEHYNRDLSMEANTSDSLLLQQIRTGATVLEFGCAAGYMTKYLKEQLQADVYIVEKDACGFEQAQHYAVDGVCADLEQLDSWSTYFGELKFDYILFADVLEHLRNPKEVLSRSSELLKADGILLASVPNVGHADILLNLYNNNWNYQAFGLLDDTHIHLFAQRNIRDLLEASGFALVCMDYVIRPPFQTEQANSKIYTIDMAVVDAICRRPYSDVYQFVLTAKKADAVGVNVSFTNRYKTRHVQYGSLPNCCIAYRDAVQKQKTAQQQACAEYKAAYETISNAFFWKVSKPFRHVVDGLKHLFRNSRAAHTLWKGMKSLKNNGVQHTWKKVINYSKYGSRNMSILQNTANQEALARLFYVPGEPITILTTKHTLYVAHLIEASLKRLSISTKIITDDQEKYGSELHIVICPQMFLHMPDKYIAFQMEQVVSSRWMTERYFDTLRNAYAVLDYSLVNIRYFKEHSDFGYKFYYLPIDYLCGYAHPQLEPKYWTN